MIMKKTMQLLETLKLRGCLKTIEELVKNAEEKQSSYFSFLNDLLDSELVDRSEKRRSRNMAGAHFPIKKRIEDFNPDCIKGITKRKIQELLDFRWIDNHHNLLLFGPPGLRKTHLAISLGVKAVEQGYTVCFERIANLVKLLKTAEIQRSSGFRIKRILRSDLVIIDEIGYTPIDRKEANLFFSLISELYEKQSIIITSNKSFDDWAEMLGDSVMTTALLDRLLHHAQIFSLDGESYRIQKQKGEKPSKA